MGSLTSYVTVAFCSWVRPLPSHSAVTSPGAGTTGHVSSRVCGAAGSRPSSLDKEPWGARRLDVLCSFGIFADSLEFGCQEPSTFLWLFEIGTVGGVQQGLGPQLGVPRGPLCLAVTTFNLGTVVVLLVFGCRSLWDDFFVISQKQVPAVGM